MAAAIAATREASESDRLKLEHELASLMNNPQLGLLSGNIDQNQVMLEDQQHDQQHIYNDTAQSYDMQQAALMQDEALINALHLGANEPIRENDEMSMSSSKMSFTTEAAAAAQMEAALLQNIVMAQQQNQERVAEVERQLEVAKLALLVQKQKTKIPDEHFLTVASDGSIILGATETITEVNPNDLLMKSLYDDVHHEDVRGLRAIQKRYWEKGSTSIVCFLRRKTLDGDWVWVRSDVVSLVDQPVPGYVIREVREKDDDDAYTCARLIRIVSLLFEAIEDAASYEEDCIYARNANLEKKHKNNPGAGSGDLQSQLNAQNILSSDLQDNSILGLLPFLKDDAQALQTILSTEDPSGDSSMHALKQILKAVENGDTGVKLDNSKKAEDDQDKKTPEIEKSVLKLCRNGSNLSLGKIELTPAEFKLIILVLVGEITVDMIGPIVMEVIESEEKDLAVSLDAISLDIEKQIKQEEQQHKQSSSKIIHRNFNRDRRRHRSAASLESAPAQTPSVDNLGITHAHLVGSDGALSSTKEKNLFGKNSTEFYDIMQSNKSSQQNFPELECFNKVTMPTVKGPWISVINLSYSLIGNFGMEMFAQVLRSNTPELKTLDLSFCNLDEKGIICLSRALKDRKSINLDGLQGLLLSGNRVTYKAAKELGAALSTSKTRVARFRKRVSHNQRGGYSEDDDSEIDEDDDFENDALFGSPDSRPKSKTSRRLNRREKKKGSGPLEKAPLPSTSKVSMKSSNKKKYEGLQLLHLCNSSLCKDGLVQILIGLGTESPIRELRIASNNIGITGVKLLGDFLEGKPFSKSNIKQGSMVMPKLDRIDLSDNKLGNDGIASLTRAVSKRGKNVHMVDLHIAHNEISSGGIETIMNKLLQQKLVVLSLDNNVIGDRGCQLVAASLTSMHHLCSLNLSFNQIGSRGITSLMRALIGCESIKFLGLSGNVMKISGAISMGFALAHHPRLSRLELDNCCLSQVAQCHIVAGIISNRWVPMQSMNGFWAGPPMLAIGALDSISQELTNEDCFRVRRDVQMKTILQWMEKNGSKATHKNAYSNSEKDLVNDDQKRNREDFLSADFLIGGSNGAAPQSAYLRMLDWLSRIPFDEQELNYLQQYFYDADFRGDGMKSSEGNLDFLKHRGDLLAALGSGSVADELRDNISLIEEPEGPPVGLIIDSEEEQVTNTLSSLKGLYEDEFFSVWESIKLPEDVRRAKLKDNQSSNQKRKKGENICSPKVDSYKVQGSDLLSKSDHGVEGILKNFEIDNKCSSTQNLISSKKRRHSDEAGYLEPLNDEQIDSASRRSITFKGSVSSLSKQSLGSKDSENSNKSNISKTGSRGGNTVKARITMFPQFSAKLDLLKASAQEMMDNEADPNQQDIIAQQFAEASLTLLRQLRYHCMNNGLDGWRQGKIKRKILIVDDSKVTRKMVARAFENANFIVDTAENGVEGVEKLKKSIYDIAFMDIDMPVMNGFDATKALRDWEDVHRPGARQPICALTAAYVDDFERSELMKFKDAGLDVMESKPCNIPRLFKVVDDVSPMFSDLSISVTQQYDSPTMCL